MAIRIEFPEKIKQCLVGFSSKITNIYTGKNNLFYPGMNGFFNIEMGQCNIDSATYACKPAL